MEFYFLTLEIPKKQIFTNIKPTKAPTFKKLYSQAQDFKLRLEEKRMEVIENLKKKSIPKILNFSKKIQRNANLFPERLYPYHKIAQEDKDNSESDKEYEYAHVATVRSNPLGISGEYENEEFKNNIDNIFHDNEELKILYGNKPEYIKYYRMKKNLKKEKFSFKPEISKRNSKSLEYSMKRSEEKKRNKNSNSNSPKKKINEYNFNSNSNPKNIFMVNKSNIKNKISEYDEKNEIYLRNKALKFPIEKNSVNEFKEYNEDEENKNNNNTLTFDKIHKLNFEKENKNANPKEKAGKYNNFEMKNKENSVFVNEDERKDSEIVRDNNVWDNHDINYLNMKNDRLDKKQDFFLYGKKMKDNSLKISDKLYCKGMNLLKRKEKLANQKIIIENEEFTKFTFKPNNTFKKSIKSDLENKNNSLAKNRSFTSGLSRSFANMKLLKNEKKHCDLTNNTKIVKNTPYDINTNKSKKKFSSDANKSNNISKYKNHKNSNIDDVNNINNRIKNSNQWQFSNKNTKKIFDSAYLALINNFNSEFINKINNFSQNDYSTNSSSNQYSNFNKNINNIQNTNNLNKLNNLNQSPNNKESYINNTGSINPDKNHNIDINQISDWEKIKINNTGVYERCKSWKENNKKNKRKMREELEKEESKVCKFSPILYKPINDEVDDRFIKSESKFINNYIKRRKASLEKIENQKSYERKIFGKSFEKYSKKLTQPEEFNFNHSISRKSKDMKNNAVNLHKPEQIKDIRRELNVSNFFNQSMVEFEDSFYNNAYLNLNKKQFSYCESFNQNNDLLTNSIKIANNNNLNKNTFIEQNRKVFNENLKIKKLEKGFSNVINIVDTNNINGVYANKEEIFKSHSNNNNHEMIKKVMNVEEINTQTDAADEFDEGVKKDLEEKLLNKQMSFNLNVNLNKKE